MDLLFTSIVLNINYGTCNRAFPLINLDEVISQHYRFSDL
jgi:hypothetical protein